jgi:isoleucyl-tRNA synthetase
MKQVSDSLRRLRNTLRFLAGSLTDFDPTLDSVPYSKLPALDKYILGKLTEVLTEVQSSYDSYHFGKVVSAISGFANIDLSTFYLDVSKDRLYISKVNEFRRRSCQTVLNHLMVQLSVMLAPVVPHLAEDLWQHLPYRSHHKSVFQHGWVRETEQFPVYDALFWSNVRELKYEVNKAIELGRATKEIGPSLQCEVVLFVQDPAFKLKLMSILGDKEGIVPSDKSVTNGVDDLRFILQVSEVSIVSSEVEVRQRCPAFNIAGQVCDGVFIGIRHTDGCRCERCWYHSKNVGSVAGSESDLCSRCVDVVHSKR